MSTVRLEGSWYVDQSNNRWSTEVYTEEEATEYSDTLINCSGCSDCRSCKDCKDCQDCDNCIACCDCSDCSYCSGCSNCRGCGYCSDCEYCLYCSNCSCCIDCRCCSNCEYCHDFRKNPQRIVGWIMGSRNDTPSVYWITPGEEQCIVGCFEGTLSALEEAVRAKHGNNPKHLRDYLKFIEVVRAYQKSVNDSGEEK